MRSHTRAAMLVLAAGAAALLAGAMAVAKGPPPPPPPATMTFPHDSHDFGAVTVGAAATQDFTLSYVYAGKTGSGKIALTLIGEGTSFAISAHTCPKAGLKPNGTCTITVRYTPQAAAADAATLRATAGLLSPQVALTGTGISPNTPPTAAPGELVVDANTDRAQITLSASDADGDRIDLWKIVDQPEHGTLSWTEDSSAGCENGVPLTCRTIIDYVPAADYGGSDSFTFTAKDSYGNTSTSATISIIVNWPPTLESQTGDTGVTVDTNSIDNSITLTGHDPDGDQLTFSIGEPPQHGTLGGWTDGERIVPSCSGTPWTCTADLTYTPDAGWFGDDSFTFYAVDEHETYSADGGAVAITVTRFNAQPTAEGQEFSTGTSGGTITLRGGDPDGDKLTFAIVDPPTNGTLKPSDPIAGNCDTTEAGASVCTAEVTYTADSDSVTSDSFTFTTDDGYGPSEPASVWIMVNVPNQSPTADGQSDLSVGHNSSLWIVLSGYDPEGTDLTFGIVEGRSPTAGTLSELGTPSCTSGICTAEVTYTPDGGTVGPDSFDFYVNDGNSDSLPATVSIDLTNQAPTANAPSGVEVVADSTGNPITLSGADTDGDGITFTLGEPSHGTLGDTVLSCSNSLATFSLAGVGTSCEVEATYTPNPGYVGTDSFSFYTSDGWADSETATVSINVSEATLPGLSINSPPFVYSNNDANLTFTVTLDATGGSDVNFNWASTDDTAIWGNTCDKTADYTSEATTGTGTITAGQTTTTITFGTCNNGPANEYPIKTPTYFTVTISNPTGATITTDTGTGEIRIS